MVWLPSWERTVSYPGTRDLSYTKQELVIILLKHALLSQHRKVCNQKPCNISASMPFVVNLEMLADARDLTADDMGAYRLSGSPLEYVYVTFENKRIRNIVCNRQHKLTNENVEELGLNDAAIFVLERKYSTCKASPDLRRMTAELKVVDPKWNGHFITHKYSLVQYAFKESDHEVFVNPHGNAKTKNRPYRKTKESVKKNLENTLQSFRLESRWIHVGNKFQWPLPRPQASVEH